MSAIAHAVDLNKDFMRSSLFKQSMLKYKNSPLLLDQ